MKFKRKWDFFRKCWRISTRAVRPEFPRGPTASVFLRNLFNYHKYHSAVLYKTDIKKINQISISHKKRFMSFTFSATNWYKPLRLVLQFYGWFSFWLLGKWLSLSYTTTTPPPQVPEVTRSSFLKTFFDFLQKTFKFWFYITTSGFQEDA